MIPAEVEVDKKNLIILTGPTAVGKTELSIRLAKEVGGEIISADSMQVYRGMDIGTAKITPDEMDGVPHYLVDCMEPEDDFNVTEFQRMAKSAMENIYANGHIPIIVGGTGFYIQSVLYDIEFDSHNLENSNNETNIVSDKEMDSRTPDCATCENSNGCGNGADEKYREDLRHIAHEQGAEYLHNMLRQVDPASAEAIHANNVKRVIRALEYYKLTGKPISAHNEQQRKKESPYNYVYFVLNDDRDILYSRIDRRVDIMFENGLEEEVRRLIDGGASRDMVSMQGIGYKEMFGYFDGEYDLEEAKRLIKQDTRHFAKRQLTWFRREQNVCWMNYQDYDSSKDKMLEAMILELKRKGIIKNTAL